MVDRITLDWRTAGLDPADVALCEYTEKLTLAPSSVGPDDIDEILPDDDVVVLHEGRVLAHEEAGTLTGGRDLTEVFIEMTEAEEVPSL